MTRLLLALLLALSLALPAYAQEEDTPPPDDAVAAQVEVQADTPAEDGPADVQDLPPNVAVAPDPTPTPTLTPTPTPVNRCQTEGCWQKYGFTIYGNPADVGPALELIHARGFDPTLATLTKYGSAVRFDMDDMSHGGEIIPGEPNVHLAAMLRGFVVSDAALIVHEAVHVNDYQAVPYGDTAKCSIYLGSERRAYAAELAFYRAVYGPTPPAPVDVDTGAASAAMKMIGDPTALEQYLQQNYAPLCTPG